MARSAPLLPFCFLLLAFTVAASGHPVRHVQTNMKLLHRGTDHGFHHHGALKTGRPRDETGDPLDGYVSELALRAVALEQIKSDTVANLKGRSEPHQRAAPPSFSFTEAQFQERLDAIDNAIQSLVNLLSNDLGEVASSSASVEAPAVTVPPAGAFYSAPSESPTPTPAVVANVRPTWTTRTMTVTPTSQTAAVSSSTPFPSAVSFNGTEPHIFNPMANDNVVVYYGQSTQTSTVPLTDICADPNVDIVILAFVPTLFGAGGWPSLNMGPHCWASTSAQSQAGASGLIDCVSDGFASKVQQCQSQGKKVMLSLGGAQGYSDTTIPSDQAAVELATTLWNLFLGGTANSTTSPLRPFGNLVLDGIDLDNESGTTAHIAVLVSSLRAIFEDNRSSRPYYLSAAPQCPRPDASIPLSSIQTTLDFVWVQFYNNPQCNLDSGQSFFASLGAWSSDLSANTNGFIDVGNGVTSPRLYIGAPSFAGAGSGYVDALGFQNVLESVNGAFLNFGGVMFWDGAYGEESAGTDGASETFMQVVKDVLG